MLNGRHATEMVPVTLGFAVSPQGRGVAYAALGDDAGSTALRVPFSLTVRPALLGRDVAYAALSAVADQLLQRGLRHVAFELDDEALVSDLSEHRAVPSPLAMPYVALRCRLNRFANVRVGASRGRTSRDLTSRAQAEAVLEIAA